MVTPLSDSQAIALLIHLHMPPPPPSALCVRLCRARCCFVANLSAGAAELGATNPSNAATTTTTTTPTIRQNDANRKGAQNLHARRRLVQAPGDEPLLVQLHDLRGHSRPGRKFPLCSPRKSKSSCLGSPSNRRRRRRRRTKFRTKILNLYVIGNLISLIALSVSLIIFISFK